MANLIESETENIDWNYGVIACKQINMESELHTHIHTHTHVHICTDVHFIMHI